MKAQKLVQVKNNYMTFPSELLSQVMGNCIEGQPYKSELICQFKALLNNQNLPCPLNPKEREILNLLSQGLTNCQALKSAGLSQSSYFMEMIYRKLGARNKVEAICIAESEGWLNACEIKPFQILNTPKKSLTANENLEIRQHGYSFRFEMKDGILTKCALMTLKKWSTLKDDWRRQAFNFLRGNNSADRWVHIAGTNYPVIIVTG